MISQAWRKWWALSLLGALGGASQLPAAEPVDSEFVITTDKALVRVTWSVVLGEQKLSRIWDKSFAALHAYHDRDGDKRLSAAEAARLPSVYAMCEVLGSGFTPSLGKPPVWEELDADKSGGVEEAEVAKYYRARGIGAPTIGVGTMSHRAPLQAALLKLIDTSGDGHISGAELDAAAALREKFDRNEDGLIGAGELVPGVLYPGAAGSQLLTAPRAQPVPNMAHFPVILLPSAPQDNALWTAELVRRRDRDGDSRLSLAEFGAGEVLFAQLDTNQDQQLAAEELATWRGSPASGDLRVVWSAPGDLPPQFVPDSAADPSQTVSSATEAWRGLEVTVRGDRGHLNEAVAATRERLGKRFQEDDADHNDQLVATEREKDKASPWHALQPVADRDADGNLTLAELNAWLDLQQQLSQGQVLFTVLDAGPGLFELIDDNHDGALSASELRGARQRLERVGALVNDALDMAKLPHVLLVTVSRGYPKSPLGLAERNGPAWFLALDRNLDGEVSSSEFAGSADAFRRLDKDASGTISATEAAEFKRD